MQHLQHCDAPVTPLRLRLRFAVLTWSGREEQRVFRTRFHQMATYSTSLVEAVALSTGREMQGHQSPVTRPKPNHKLDDKRASFNHGEADKDRLYLDGLYYITG